MDRPTLVAGGIVAAVLVAGVALWFTLSEAARPEPVLMAAPEPAPARPAPAPRPALAPEPDPEPVQRPKVYHLPPPGQEEPADLPPSEPASLTREETTSFQRAAMSAVNAAKEVCLEPWAAAGNRAEVVMDAVVHDGVVIDVQLKTLTELPPDVVECVRDMAWQTPWPEAESLGEVRFQHDIRVK